MHFARLYINYIRIKDINIMTMAVMDIISGYFIYITKK
ncbi:hypothetical protein CZ809_00904 [Photobacterium piscicola]|uniref:Uncharacterized protein n=1 Tax=Photobacterium piscicola TaxID=1378299 RepID=A0A1T5HXK7_9GAMM|nr:hypothetical protein CZ809_00904 [Photobacterium piscicola]